MGKKLIFIIFLVIILGGGYFAYWKLKAAKPSAPGPASGPPPVQVRTPVVQDVEEYYEFTGNTAAVEQVEVRARVEGFLTSIAFTDGAEVKQGDLLFTIEPEAFQARRDQALAQLQSAQAERERAQLDYERVEKAVQTNAVSQQELSTRKADREKAQAAVAAAKAILETAELNLSYTRIVSPVDGVVSRRFVDVGNLVGAGEQTRLATIVKIRPIYVYFNASEEQLQNYFLDHRPGQNAAEPVRFSAGLSETDDFSRQGVLDYLDNRVDSQTGTITLRGVLPNETRPLLPGMFVRIRVPTGIRKDAVLVEERALISDISGKTVLTVDEKNIVHSQPVQLGKKVGLMRVVESGLEGHPRYVVSGFHFAHPGSPVTPIQAGESNPSASGGPTNQP